MLYGAKRLRFSGAWVGGGVAYEKSLDLWNAKALQPCGFLVFRLKGQCMLMLA